MLTMAGALVAAMFGLLATVLGFFGARARNKQDEIVKSVGALKDEVVKAVSSVKDELHERISEYQTAQAEKWNGIERRVTAIESRCAVIHRQAQD